MHFYGRVSIFRVLWPPQRSRPATATNGLTGSLIASRRVPAVAQRDTRRLLHGGGGSGDGIAATICVKHDFPLLIYTLHSRLHNKILNPYQIQVLGRPRPPSRRGHDDGHHSSSCGCARWQPGILAVAIQSSSVNQTPLGPQMGDSKIDSRGID